MCKIIIVEPDETECHTHAQLMEALGGMPVYKHVDDQVADDCLCDLDVEKTAATYGYRADREPGEMFTVFHPLPTQEPTTCPER